MSNWKEIVDKKPWLLEYFKPSGGSRFNVLATLYSSDNGSNKNSGGNGNRGGDGSNKNNDKK